MKHLLPVLSLLLLVCCSTQPGPRAKVSKGGRHYGGIFNINETEEIRSIFPLSLTQAAAHRIGVQVYQGLVRFNMVDLSVQPCLATSWDVDASGTSYTFRIRSDVRFHDDPCFPDGRGRLMDARDVVDCLTAVCHAHERNQMFWLFQDRVVGANAYYNATAKGERPAGGVKGIELVDDRTVRITLLGPWPNFLQVLGHQGCWIYPRELVAHHGPRIHEHAVGTGPFRINSYRKGEALVLERNASYWEKDDEGDPLPYLDGIRYTFEGDKQRELQQFLEGPLTMVYELPVDRTDVLDVPTHGATGYVVQSTPALSVQFYGFNGMRPPFNDKRIRQAFAMAIDRQWLVDSVLSGLAYPALHGVVAPGLADYPYQLVQGVSHDPARARELLAEAGHPGGKGLPTVFIQVNNTGSGYVRVATVVQSMLERELGVKVATSVLPAQQHFGRIERGEADLWREGWIADHPDAENFLSLFYGKNAPEDPSEPAYLNSTRFRDARFDSLFMEAQRTADMRLRMELLAKAEARMMEELPVVPLYHERAVRLLKPWVRDLPINGLDYRELCRVWFDVEVQASR